MKTALYRHFDAGGKLLYVGISLSAVQRLSQHKQTAKWFGKIARIDIEWWPDRASALTAEAIAIAREAPAWNIAGIGRHAPAPPPQRIVPGAIRHLRTGRLNGWYAQDEDAKHMLGWFRAVFQGEEFELIRPPPGGDNYIHQHLDLKPFDWRLWSSAAPDWAAGDAFDARVAA